MNQTQSSQIGFTCAYTPLPLLHAAGYSPYRILPMGDAPDAAGTVLHDNLCPHAKRIVDRALANDLPELSGLVVMNSCETMRRLADAWTTIRPRERMVLVDLPATRDDRAVRFFTGELERLSELLSLWAGRPITDERIFESVDCYTELAHGLERLSRRASRGTLPGGWKTLQSLRNHSVASPLEETLAEVRRLESTADAGHGEAAAARSTSGSPVTTQDAGLRNAAPLHQAASSPPGSARPPLFLFGNVLPDPEALELFGTCGAHLVADDLCTGSRQLVAMKPDQSQPPLPQLARALLSRPPCARSLPLESGQNLPDQVVARARASGARGVVAHIMKFCDPYLARMPAIRQALKQAGLPLLVLEGDCSLRSLGQHRTRIEAFVEMLGGSPQ